MIKKSSNVGFQIIARNEEYIMVIIPKEKKKSYNRDNRTIN